MRNDTDGHMRSKALENPGTPVSTMHCKATRDYHGVVNASQDTGSLLSSRNGAPEQTNHSEVPDLETRLMQ